MPAPIGTTGKSKDHRSRKDPHAAQEAAERQHAANATPERKIAQLRYRLSTIEDAVTTGRQQYEAVEAEVTRLRSELEALEASNG